MDIDSIEFYEFVDRCESIEELKTLYNETCGQQEKDAKRCHALKEEIEELTREVQAIQKKHNFFVSDWGYRIKIKIGELMLATNGKQGMTGRKYKK